VLALSPDPKHGVEAGTVVQDDASNKDRRRTIIPPGERRRLAKERKKATREWLPSSEWRKLQRAKRKRTPDDTPPGKGSMSGVSPLRRQEPKRQRRSDDSAHHGARGAASTSADPTFRDQLTSRKLAIVPAAYPDVKLSDEDCFRIQATLGDLMIDDDSEGPLQISKTFQEKGAIVAVCCNSATCDWLKGKAAALSPGEGVELLVGEYKDLLRSIKVIVRIDKAFPQAKHLKPKRVLLGLQKQNPGIITKDWRIVGGRQEAEFQTLVLD